MKIEYNQSLEPIRRTVVDINWTNPDKEEIDYKQSFEFKENKKEKRIKVSYNNLKEYFNGNLPRNS